MVQQQDFYVMTVLKSNSLFGFSTKENPLVYHPIKQEKCVSYSCLQL
jgi:hypothetical protein